MRCARCETPSPEGFKYCGECGARLMATAPPAGEPGTVRSGWVGDQPAGRPPVGPADLGLAEADRREVTVLFADVAGFTALSEKLEPETVTEIMNECWVALCPAITQYGGHIDKFIGDGVMAVFGAPEAHEDDPVRALLAALAMQRALREFGTELEARRGFSLGMRIGVNSGTVIAGPMGPAGYAAYTVMGDPVNVASRLEHEAPVGSILIGPLTYQRARLAFEFVEHGPIPVRGKAEPVPVYEVVAAKGAGVVQWRETHDVPLVGRAAELQALHQSLARAVSGHGTLAFVVGEPGVGKSRLLAEFRAQAGEAAAWHVVGQPPYGVRLPFSGLVTLVRALLGIDDQLAEAEVRERIAAAGARIGPDGGTAEAGMLADLLGVAWQDRLVDALDPANRRLFLIHTLVALVRDAVRDRPLVLVLEDLHFMDAASRDIADAVLRSIAALPILVVGTYRPDWSNPWAELAPAEPLRLQTLAPEEACAYVAALAGDLALPEATIEAVYQRTAGNALFIGEVVRALRERASGGESLDPRHLHLPGTVQELIQARVDRLAPAPRRVLQVGSVVGATFEEPILARLPEVRAGLDEALAEVKRHEFVDETAPAPERAFTFRHVLAQEVIYANVLGARRGQLHRLVAAVMERLYQSQLDERAGRLAEHFEQSDEPVRAIPYLLRAGERAARLAGTGEAAAYARRAIALMQANPADHAGELITAYERLAAATEQLGDTDACLVAYTSALALARAAGDAPGTGRGDHAGRIGSAMATIEAMEAAGDEPPRERAERVLEALRAETAEVAAGGPRPREAGLYGRIGEVYRYRKSPATALEWYDAGLRLLGSEPSPEHVRLEFERAYALYWQGQVEAAVQRCGETIALAERFGPSVELGRVRNLLGLICLDLGHWERAATLHRDALTVTRALGDPLHETNSRLNLAMAEHIAGQPGHAIEQSLACLAIAERFGLTTNTARIRSNLAWYYLDGGRVAEAIALYASLLPEMEQLELYRNVLVAASGLGGALLRARRPREALAPLRRALAVAEQTQVWEYLPTIHHRLALAHLYTGDLAAALEQAEASVERARAAKAREEDLAEALRVRGQAYQALGRLAEARADLEASEAMMQAATGWYQLILARTLLRLGELYQQLEAEGVAHFEGERRPLVLIARARAIFDAFEAAAATVGTSDPMLARHA